jgi:hypothetical protein
VIEMSLQLKGGPDRIEEARFAGVAQGRLVSAGLVAKKCMGYTF